MHVCVYIYIYIDIHHIMIFIILWVLTMSSRAMLFDCTNSCYPARRTRRQGPGRPSTRSRGRRPPVRITLQIMTTIIMITTTTTTTTTTNSTTNSTNNDNNDNDNSDSHNFTAARPGPVQPVFGLQGARRRGRRPHPAARGRRPGDVRRRPYNISLSPSLSFSLSLYIYIYDISIDNIL